MKCDGPMLCRVAVAHICRSNARCIQAKVCREERGKQERMDDGEEDISTRLRKLKQSRRRQTPRRVFLAANLCLLLVLVLAVSATLALRHASDQQAATLPSYQGTYLGAVPAPNFQLVDQTGHIVSLAQLRGHPVVLTFLYTHCPGPCPLLAEKLHFTVEILGQEAFRVEWVAVSLDPKGDTPASARAFVATHHLTGRLQFLLGSQSRLEPIWKAYFNVPQVQSQLNTLQGPALRKEPRSRKVDKCGTVALSAEFSKQ
jgi:protein SCO1/2